MPEKRSGGGAGQFIGEVREELKKTSFPSREDVTNTTIIVIVNVIFFAIFLFLVDQAWVFILGDNEHPTGLTWLINKIAGL
ncbi:MAG: preprotein translocase subunit SecE [Pyrinomonadaceae bacterium]